MFKEIFPHLSKLKVNMTIIKNGNELIVSVIPTIFGGEEAVNKAIPPFTVKGTPEELDEKFCTAFATAAVFLTQQGADIEKWKEQAKAATEKSEGAKKLKDEKDKKDKENKQKAMKDIDLGDKQFKEKKYDAAKLYYRTALTTMGGKDSGLEKKIAECDKLSGGDGLFGTPSTPAPANEDNTNTKSSEELNEEPMDEGEDTDAPTTDTTEEDDDWG